MRRWARRQVADISFKAIVGSCVVLLMAQAVAGAVEVIRPGQQPHSQVIVMHEIGKDAFVPSTGATRILGPSEITMAQAIRYIKTRNPQPQLEVPVDEFVEMYWEEAGHEGIRPDVALAQAILETNCFKFGGDVIPEQNNYAGIGTTGNGIRGHYFATARAGIRAHVQHLMAYATYQRPSRPILDPRYETVRNSRYFGQCTTVESLNGKWAVPGHNYGQNIRKTLEYMQQAPK